MHLIQCYISGFGTLQDVSLEFDRGLNSFYAPNGQGKTTLQAFLKAMLYGLPSYKANSKGFEDRRHYCPFSGAAFGGSLTLAHQGKTYCITRHFDPKSEARDQYQVTCQGLPTRDLGDCPGRAIFQVDRDAFERTAFFTAQPGELSAGGDIAQRLQAMVDNTAPEQDYARAYQSLAEAARQLQGPRGQRGKLPELAAQIQALTVQVENKQALETSLEEDHAQRQRLEAAIHGAQCQLEAAQENALLAERWQVYQEKQALAAHKASQAAQLRQACGSPQPTGAQQQTLRQCRDDLAAMARQDQDTFPLEKQAQLLALNRAYPYGMPGGEDIRRAEALHHQLQQPQSLPAKPRLWLLVLALGVLLALGGGALAWLRLWPGVAMAAVGVVLAVCAGVVHMKKQSAWRRACQTQQRRREALGQELAALLSPYGIGDYHPRLSQDAYDLEALTRERQAFQAQAAADQAQQAAQDYRREYGLTGPAQPQADTRALQQTLAGYRQQLANLNRQILDSEADLEDLAETPLRLEEAREQHSQLQQHYHLLLTARGCLEAAEQNLRRKHIHPVRSRFDQYAAQLAPALGARLALDEGFRLYLREKAGEFDPRHLSAGELTMAALCLRLSLLDNLYGERQCPVFLDDPFVFLDETHLAKTRQMLALLAQSRQMLYVTCHESRKI